MRGTVDWQFRQRNDHKKRLKTIGKDSKTRGWPTEEFDRFYQFLMEVQKNPLTHFWCLNSNEIKPRNSGRQNSRKPAPQ